MRGIKILLIGIPLFPGVRANLIGRTSEKIVVYEKSRSPGRAFREGTKTGGWLLNWVS